VIFVAHIYFCIYMYMYMRNMLFSMYIYMLSE
jgi:hypothetical protein